MNALPAQPAYRPSRSWPSSRRCARAICPRTAAACSPTSTTPAVDGLDELARSAYRLAAHVNGLDPTAFPSLLAMENALVAAAGGLLGGGPGGVDTVVGSVTSGGTESLILAVKAARDARPDVARPRLVMPATAHAAFAKAGALPAGRARRRAGRPADAARRSGRDGRRDRAGHGAGGRARRRRTRTGSSTRSRRSPPPRRPRGVRCHVDACFGGWVLPYLRRLGVDRAAVRLLVPGRHQRSPSTCTSTRTRRRASRSCCTATRRCALPQYFAYADWPGYTMINPVIASTRSGGPIAGGRGPRCGTSATTATCGWPSLTRDAVAGLAAAVAAVDGLRLLPGRTRRSSPSPRPTRRSTCSCSADELAARGWHTQPQFALRRRCRATHPPDGDRRRWRRASPSSPPTSPTRRPPPGPASAPAGRRSAGSLDPAMVPSPSWPPAAAGLGLVAGARRMAPVNALLDVAPPAVRERAADRVPQPRCQRPPAPRPNGPM